MILQHRISRGHWGGGGTDVEIQSMLDAASAGDAIKLARGELYKISNPLIWPIANNLTLDLNGSTLKVVEDVHFTLVNTTAIFPTDTNIVVTSTAGFEVGDYICVKDALVQNYEMRRITNIPSSTDIDVHLAFTKSHAVGMRVLRMFPTIIVGNHVWEGSVYTTTTYPTITNGIIRGNKSSHDMYETFLASTVSLLKTNHATVEGLSIYDSVNEGVSDQGYQGVTPDLANSINDLHVENAFGRGLHVGSGWPGSTIQDVTIKDCMTAGVYLCDNCRDGTYTDIDIDSCGLGLEGIGLSAVDAVPGDGTYDSGNVFTRVYVHDCAELSNGIDTSSGNGIDLVKSDPAAPDVQNCEGNEFYDCRVYDNAGYGYNISRQENLIISGGRVNGNGNTGVFCDPTQKTTATGFVLEHCLIYDNTGTNVRGVDLAYMIAPTINDCLVSGNSQHGIAVQITCDESSSGAADIVIKHSTVVYNGDSGGEMGIVRPSDGAAMTITDCAIWGNGGAEIFPTTGANVDYCCIQGIYTGEGANCIHTDPDFVVGTYSSYYLAADSPCINAGSMSAIAAGLDAKTTQVLGGLDADTVDIGVHYTP